MRPRFTSSVAPTAIQHRIRTFRTRPIVVPDDGAQPEHAGEERRARLVDAHRQAART